MSTSKDHSEERQVSETSAMDENAAGGADATDKSTGTAPHQADEEPEAPPVEG